MSPGTYIAKRRTAAGLSIGEVAAALARFPGERQRLLVLLGELERDSIHVTRSMLDRLRRCFRFDVLVAEQLLDLHLSGDAAEVLPHPQLCRACACSWHDPCETDDGPCAWAERDLCTSCAEDPDGEPEETPAGALLAVNDDAARAAA